MQKLQPEILGVELQNDQGPNQPSSRLNTSKIMLNEHRSALRGTSRAGFAGVPNALNLELWVSCVVLPSGENPRPSISFTLGLAGALCDFPRCCALVVCVLLFVHSHEPRVDEAPHQFAVLENPPAWRRFAPAARREKPHPTLVLEAWPAAPSPRSQSAHRYLKEHAC